MSEAIRTSSGCLEVTSWKPQPKGYIRGPRVDERSPQMIHRLAMEVTLSRRLTPTETVDHLCHNSDKSCPGGESCPHRRCIEPTHLEIVDAVENWSRGRLGVVQTRREKTHCPNGHPYEVPNLRANKNGYRSCKACHRAKMAGRDPKAEPTYLT